MEIYELDARDDLTKGNVCRIDKQHENETECLSLSYRTLYVCPPTTGLLRYPDRTNTPTYLP